MQVKAKEPVLAAILSLLLGAGAIYNGQVAKGIVFILVRLTMGVLACIILFLPTGLPEMGMAWAGCLCSITPLVVSVVLAVLDAIDAYMLAQRFNEVGVLRPWEFFTK